MFNLLVGFFLSIEEIFDRFRRNRNGVTAIEYGLIAVALASFLMIILYGENNFILATEAKFQQLGEKVARVVLNN